MADVKVYEPCVYCQGNGWTQPDQPSGITKLVGVNYGPLMVCRACGGTGKGKVKEIREGGE